MVCYQCLARRGEKPDSFPFDWHWFLFLGKGDIQGKDLSMVDIADLARSGYLTSIASEARSLIQRYDIREVIRQSQSFQRYDIREVIRQSQSFQPYWIDWSYIPSHERIKFLIRLNKVSNNITPALSITEIVLLWFQDFEDKKKRIKKAEKLIKLILNGFLTASFYSLINR